MNKPQCTTAAQCLKELARVMEQFEIVESLDAINSGYVRNSTGTYNNSMNMPAFKYPTEWSFALFELEGKPVFIGDELYRKDGHKFEVCQFGFDRCEDNDLKSFSWNLPRKTATLSINGGEPVEVESVKSISLRYPISDIVQIKCNSVSYAEQLCKALQPLVKD